MAYKFGTDGQITDGELVGLEVDLAAQREQAKAAYEAQYPDKYSRMYAPAFQDPYATGGQLQGLKFGNDGKLYGVLGYQATDPESGQAPTPITAAIKGWNYDTSTLKQSPYYQPGAQLTLYDAAIEKDDSSYLIKVTDPNSGYTAGWARQMLQAEIMPDVTSAKNRSVLGSDPRLVKRGPDARKANPGQNR